MPIYRLPASSLPGFLWSWLTLRPRSFADDAQRAVAGLTPAPTVLGAEHVPRQGPCLVTCNHYTRPGLAAWWLTFAVSAAVAAQRAPGADPQIHWVMTAAWTFPGSRWRRRILTPATYWAFARVARIYGFVPMPPDPGQVEARALAVLQTVRLGRQLVQRGGMLGLAPEGRDVPGGVPAGMPAVLGEPPPGAGEFIALLVKLGFPVLPVGVAEPRRQLCLSVGPPFVPEVPPGRGERDAVVAGQVMGAIARQLSSAR